MRNSKGFTLIEIIVAVALVAILSAAVAPSVLNNIAQGRIARAQSDVQAIASGIMRFKSDVGKYPRLAKAAYPDTAGMAFAFLADSLGTFPTAITGANWPTVFTSNSVAASSCEDIFTHLILGKDRAGNVVSDSYPRIKAPDNPDDPTKTGFRGGLLSADAADPWGKKYLVNVKSLGVSGQAVWVISAGPNGVLETLVDVSGTGAANTLANDDIGFRVQ